MMPKTSNSPTSPSTNKNTHSTGAPSQLNQGSRKGKRAWRKNVDLEDVEQGLENIRAEERVTGFVVLCFTYPIYNFWKVGQRYTAKPTKTYLPLTLRAMMKAS
jgi:hypothetical protein